MRKIYLLRKIQREKRLKSVRRHFTFGGERMRIEITQAKRGIHWPNSLKLGHTSCVTQRAYFPLLLLFLWCVAGLVTYGSETLESKVKALNFPLLESKSKPSGNKSEESTLLPLLSKSGYLHVVEEAHSETQDSRENAP